MWLIAFIGFILLLLSLPYVYAVYISDSFQSFGGFLLNPIDGNSYLAKMRQGFDGAWAFTLPYTAQPGDPAPINLYYIFLGHLARWLHFPLILVFHLARLAGAAALLLALYHFCSRIFEDLRTRWLALGLTSLGSGLGWLALAFGNFTPDFWVAEAYPFLASYANPHFALGLALQVFLLTPLRQSGLFTWQPRAIYFLASALISLVYPFGFAVVGIVLFLDVAWRLIRRVPFRAQGERLLAVGVGGGPYALYALLLVNTHPVLSQWNAQNLTATPHLLDLVLAFSPALLLALGGGYLALRRRSSEYTLLVAWVASAFILIFVPINLQRRLLSGLFIPLGLLASFAVQSLTRNWRRWAWLPIVLIMLSLSTNTIILLAGINAIRTHDSAIYISSDELEAFAWLEENAAPGALVLAAPETSNLLPAYSQTKVVYGHPFETVNAAQQLNLITAFFSLGLRDWQSEPAIGALLDRADYIFYGPRERAIGSLPDLEAWVPAFEQGAVLILESTRQ